MLTATTVFWYRRHQPQATRPYRVWGYPLVPAVFIASAAVVLVASFVGNLRGSLMGTALILAGLPLFAWLQRHAAQPKA
jgi:APA family basic amino acid/polyamine antiporter